MGTTQEVRPAAAESQTPRQLYFQLGNVFVLRGLHARAMGAYQLALEEQEDPDPPRNEILVRLAAAYRASGDSQSAFHTYLEAVASAPQSAGSFLPEAHRILTREIARAECEWVLGDWTSHLAVADLPDDQNKELQVLLGRVGLYAEDPRALQHFQLAFEQAPEDLVVLEGLGESLYRAGQVDRAVEILRRARVRADAAHSDRLLRIIAKLAVALVDRGEFEQALAEIPAVLPEGNGEIYPLLVARSRSHLALGHLAEALTSAEDAAARLPAAIDAHLLKAQALIGLKRYSDAVNAANQALLADPARVEVPFLKARALIEGQIDIKQGRKLLTRYQQAAQPEAEIPAVPPLADGDSHFFLSYYYLVLGRAEDALREIEEALKAGMTADGGDYRDAPAWRLKAKLLEAAGKKEEASQSLFEAGKRSHWRGEYDTAIEELRRANELQPSQAPVFWFLSEALRMRCAIPEPPYSDAAILQQSMDAWNQGAAIAAPAVDYWWAYITRALISESQSRLTTTDAAALWWEAVMYSVLALLLDDQKAESWAYLGRMHRNLRTDLCTLRATAKAVELDATSPFVLEERAAILGNMGQDEEAEQVIGKRQELGKTHWATAVQAFISMHRERYEEALARIDDAIASDPRTMWYHEQRLLCYFMLDREISPRVTAEAQLMWSRYDPANASDQSQFGLAALTLGDTERALPIFESLRAQPGSDAAALRNCGFCCLAAGDLARGEEYLSSGIDSAGPRDLDELRRQMFQLLKCLVAGKEYNAGVLEALSRMDLKIERRREELARPSTVEQEIEQIIDNLQKEKQVDTRAMAGARTAQAFWCLQDRQWRAAAQAFGTAQALETAALNAVLAGGLQKAVDGALAECDKQLREERLDEALQQLSWLMELHAAEADRKLRANLLSRRAWAVVGAANPAEAGAIFQSALQLYRDSQDPEPGRRLAEACLSGIGSVKAYWTLDTEWQALQNAAGAEDRADLTAARSTLAQYLTDACKLSARSGETADMPLETTHVLLEIGSGLVPEDSGPEWSLLKTYLPEMRGRIDKDLGVTVPGVLARVNQGLAANGYSFAVDEIVAGSGRVAPDCQYCTAPPDVLKGFGIPEDALIACPHPLTGTPGCWVKAVGWDRAKAWQQELWDDPMKFVVYHLEAVLRQKLADFVGLEEVEAMLRRWSKTDGGATLIKTILPDGRARLRFARALRSMAAERTPITDWKEMLVSLAGVDLAVEETDAIVRLMRLRIKQRLPGNLHGAMRAELPATLDEWLMSNLQRQGRKRFLALLSQDMTAFLKAVQQGLESKLDRAVLITRNAELRASLRRLVALDFPGLAVMSLEELNLEPPETAGPEPAQGRVQ